MNFMKGDKERQPDTLLVGHVTSFMGHSVGIDQGQTQSVKGSVNKGGVSQCLLTDQVNRFRGIPVMTAI